jgi:uncharacterized damage-inducible protein DinB
MPMHYAHISIADREVPKAALPMAQHLLDTYASETNKVATVWSSFRDADLSFRPHARSSTVLEVLRHQLLSERRFFAEFLGTPEPPADAVLPASPTVAAYSERFLALARPRLEHLAARGEPWWLETVPFFDVTRQRIWVFWRRVLHTAHHRTQLSVYLRLLDRPVPPVYGPTADASWDSADPTTTVDAAGRR